MLWVAITYVQHIIPLSVRYSHADVQRGACLGNGDCFHFLFMLSPCSFLYVNPVQPFQLKSNAVHGRQALS